jgi:hypothetical protein
MTGSAKQSMPPHGERWIASSLTLLAMTAGMKGAFAKRAAAPDRSDEAAAIHRGLRGEEPDASGVARRHRAHPPSFTSGMPAGFGAEIVNAGTFLP